MKILIFMFLVCYTGIMIKVNTEYINKVKALTYEDFKDGKNSEYLQDWNNLQKTPQKTRTFTFAEHAFPDRIRHFMRDNYPQNEHLMSDIYPKYAYIRHNKDVDKDGRAVLPHVHFYLEFKNPRSFASVANELQIPVNNLQKVFSKSGILAYLTHENEPDKYHYDKHDVVSNFNILQEMTPSRKIDFKELSDDYFMLRRGKMTYSDFVTKYEAQCRTIPLNGQLTILEKVYRACDMRGSASPSCSEFTVPKDFG